MSTDVSNEKKERDGKGRFTEGNSGGPGGSRPGSGRKPKPNDETLLKELYRLLDEAAPLAMELLTNQLRHEDPKIAQGAARVIMDKVLPNQTRLQAAFEGQAKDRPVFDPRLAALFTSEALAAATSDNAIDCNWSDLEAIEAD
jgi:hypothetical protein